MLGYIILFCVIGAFLSIVNIKIASVIILTITIAWSFVMGPWAIATFIELVIGYIIGSSIMGKDKETKDD